MTKKNVMSWIAGALAIAGSATGCGSKAVDIGDDTPPAVLGASLSDYQGSWIGYVELGTWDDGTQTVHLELDENGNGVIEFGEADPLPPPDAESGYPPNLPINPMSGAEQPSGVVSGFSYPIEGALVESKRIRLGSHHVELYREWCELLAPVANPNIGTGYACMSSWVTSDGTTCTLQDTGEEVDCGLAGCMQVCNCDEDGCVVGGDETDDIRMDAKLEAEGEELDGSFAVPQGSYRILMTRED